MPTPICSFIPTCASCNVTYTSFTKIRGLCSFLLNLGRLKPALDNGVRKKWSIWLPRLDQKKSYNSAWLFFLLSLSLSLLESSHHVVRKLKPNREATCGFSCRQPQPASSQHLHPLPEMWENAIHIIPVPTSLPAEAPDTVEQKQAIPAVRCLNFRTTETMNDKKIIIVF